MRPKVFTSATARRKRRPTTSSVSLHKGFWKRSPIAPEANSKASEKGDEALTSICTDGSAKLGNLPEGRVTHVVSHAAHQASGELEDDKLEIDKAAILGATSKMCSGVGKEARQIDVGQGLQVCVAEETQAGLALDSPQRTIGIYDAVA